MRDRQKEIYERIINSQGFKRQSYIRRMTAILILPVWFAVMTAAYFLSKYLDLPKDITYLSAFIASIIFCLVLAEKKARTKFPNNSGEQ